VDTATRDLVADIRSPDRDARNRAYQAVMDATDTAVDWAYEVWSDVVADLAHKDNHVRAIAAQLLCNLAKSDPDLRVLADLPALLEVTRDARFVTARHCLQALWKVGAAGPEQRAAYRAALVDRFAGCRAEKNWSLIRYDILQSLRTVHDATGDETLRATAEHLIDTETDPKYRKKYATLWRR
jgi:quinol monooxygenase YgiN